MSESKQDHESGRDQSYTSKYRNVGGYADKTASKEVIERRRESHKSMPGYPWECPNGHESEDCYRCSECGKDLVDAGSGSHSSTGGMT